MRTLKPGAPLLVYLYYRFDNRPAWYARLWKMSEAARYVVSRMPHGPRYVASQVFTGACTGRSLAQPVSTSGSAARPTVCRSRSIATSRSTRYARDRLGTRLEKRYTRAEIEVLLRNAGL